MKYRASCSCIPLQVDSGKLLILWRGVLFPREPAEPISFWNLNKLLKTVPFGLKGFFCRTCVQYFRTKRRRWLSLFYFFQFCTFVIWSMQIIVRICYSSWLNKYFPKLNYPIYRRLHVYGRNFNFFLQVAASATYCIFYRWTRISYVTPVISLAYTTYGTCTSSIL